LLLRQQAADDGNALSVELGLDADPVTVLNAFLDRPLRWFRCHPLSTLLASFLPFRRSRGSPISDMFPWPAGYLPAGATAT
jgi:hypothetical protein